jgi:hypothetical protein
MLQSRTGVLSTPMGVYPQFFASYPQNRGIGEFLSHLQSPKYGRFRIRKTGSLGLSGGGTRMTRMSPLKKTFSNREGREEREENSKTI